MAILGICCPVRVDDLLPVHVHLRTYFIKGFIPALAKHYKYRSAGLHFAESPNKANLWLRTTPTTCLALNAYKLSNVTYEMIQGSI